ncbi:MAG: hypothetical protein R3200_14450 [Xanthomonadales bacterium]|nr:hypothetical protein [Xanthomonadales bacterium]
MAFGQSHAAPEAELLVSTFDLEGSTELAFDVVGDAQISALDFSITIPNAAERNIDLGGCASGLPSTHTGQCMMVGQELRVIIYSPTNETMGGGEIGSVRIKGLAGDVQLNQVNMFSDSGKALQAKFTSVNESLTKPGREVQK